MSVTESIKNIHQGSFSQYLKITEKIGGIVYEQSKLIDVLFLLQINFLSIVQKYKKPVHEQDLNIFTQPISIQIKRIRRIAENNPSSTYISHLGLIGETVKIFEWPKQKNLEEFITQVKNKTSPYLVKLQSEVLKLDIKHIDWIYWYKRWVEDLFNFLVEFYKDGLKWSGTEKLPTFLLGDFPEIYKKLDHLKLFQEINRGESIIQILRHTHINREEEEEE